MRALCLSVVPQTVGCNAKCRCCLSRTNFNVDGRKKLNLGVVRRACRFAKDLGAQSAIITGKGEPTMMDRVHLVEVTKVLGEFFSQIDFHTNGLLLPYLGPDYIRTLYGAGLTNLTLSIAHYDDKKNAEVMGILKPYIEKTFDWLKTYGDGIHVRLSCLLARGYIDSPEEMKKYCDFAADHGVSAVVFRGLWVKDGKTEQDVWSRDHRVDMATLFKEFVRTYGLPSIMSLPWGDVYEYRDMSLTATECDYREKDFVKSLNLLPDNHLYYEWGSKASKLW